ncbi:MAG: acetylglutamate kinase [Proteobacteria bacterium]|nr:acetylglutamate kinase [Pseudomonadota bacterium]
MDQFIEKARVLVEALPWIRAFADRTVVIKYGGAAMLDDELKASFARDVTLLRYIGVRPVIVHGGGPQIGEMLARLGKSSEFVDGVRVTDDETMEVVEMVLGGRVNAEIVSLVERAGGRAVGLSGRDCGFIEVERMLGPDGEDIGRVGRPVRVSPQLLNGMTEQGLVPVVAPLGSGGDGRAYNINADTAAGAVAEALEAEKLILLTDVEGVLDADGALLRQMTRGAADRAIAEGSLSGGMIPKVRCCLHALDHGVTTAHIIDGRLPHALLLEIFTDGGVGTQITADG